ncbi:MAG: FAD-dependent oxidoreductase [Nitrolancea sp.]
MPKVAVIGAGVVGSSIAFRLAQAGADVVLIDRGRPASGTTGASFAWANANQKTPRPYFELNFEGMREHNRLTEDFGGSPWLHRTGNLIWSDEPAEIEARVQRLIDWGYAAEWRDARDVMQTLESNLRVPDPSQRIAFFPEECWVDAPSLARALIERGKQHGLQTRFDAEVTGIEVGDAGVESIQLAGSERIEVGAVVNAAGPTADKVAAFVGRSLPLAPTGGLLVRVGASPTPIGRLAHTPQVNIRPDGDGVVLLHHDSIDHQLGDRTSIPAEDPLVTELLRRARLVLDGLDDAAVIDTRVGIRPYPQDGLTCAGAVSRIDGYYEAVTHSGVTLGPLLGRLMTRVVLEGQVDPLLGEFSPTRFS